MSIATGSATKLLTTSLKVGYEVQEGNGLFQGALVSGVTQQIIDKAYPTGIYTGYLFTSFTCGDDTEITTFKVEIEQESYGTYGTDFFVNTAMNADYPYQVVFPITFFSSTEDDDQLILNIRSTFTGTAPTITYNYIKMYKVV
jgi:hypothetical protein